jgi:hypothetical protein
MEMEMDSVYIVVAYDEDGHERINSVHRTLDGAESERQSLLAPFNGGAPLFSPDEVGITSRVVTT